MKKFFAFIFAFAIAASLAACGCMRSNETQNTTENTTTPTTMTDMIPTIETNIPDPSVDTEMPIYTEGIDTSETTDPAATAK